MNGRLDDMLRLIRERDADRRDAMVDLQETQRARLELLLKDLDDVIADIPDETNLFDFRISHGERPRLWVDATTFVVMSKDNESYRFLRDTRQGRLMLQESEERTTISNAVINYVAERLTERERALSSPPYAAHNRAYPEVVKDEKLAPKRQENGGFTPQPPALEPRPIRKEGRAMRSFFYFLLGVITGMAGLVLLALYRNQLGL